MTEPSIEIRRAGPEDRDDAVELCRTALGWGADDPNEAFFSWKHDENAFGTSPIWVAESDGRMLGVRTFLRWRFRDSTGEVLNAVRAVDTATHPDAQGKGIFRKLTLGALPELREMGVHFVFNTPNAKSRPGYLKMGWGEVGTVPVAVRIAGPSGFTAIAGARTAASKWSEACTLGLDPTEAFVDEDDCRRLLARVERPAAIATDRDPAFLRWRYSFGPLAYRVMPVGDSIADGAVVFRLRTRGTAVEATIAELLVPSPRSARAVVAKILRETSADFAIAGGSRELLGAGFVPAPRIGPMLTWKPIVRLGVPRRRELALTMGDVELF